MYAVERDRNVYNYVVDYINELIGEDKKDLAALEGFAGAVSSKYWDYNTVKDMRYSAKEKLVIDGGVDTNGRTLGSYKITVWRGEKLLFKTEHSTEGDSYELAI